jgi:hypothetical protein
MYRFANLAAALALAGTACAHDGSHKSGRVPVLVELFTSEGCSSCPPADKLLERLQKDQPANGAFIVPLSEHVDYWNSASWRDPFSSAAFSERQSEYVRALHVDSPYTPQMVVNGRTEFVGSDEDSALAAIERAAKSETADVQLSGVSIGISGVTGSIRIGSVSASGQDSNDVFVAVTQDNLASSVRGGENGGHRLTHTAVVRTMKRIGTVTGTSFSGTFKVGLSPAWRTQDLSVVAFVQSRRSKRILGADLQKPGH